MGDVVPGRSLEVVEASARDLWSWAPGCLLFESPVLSRKRALEGPTLLPRLFHFLCLPWV